MGNEETSLEGDSWALHVSVNMQQIKLSVFVTEQHFYLFIFSF